MMIQTRNYVPLTATDWEFLIDRILTQHEKEYGPISMCHNLLAILTKEICREQKDLCRYLKIDEVMRWGEECDEFLENHNIKVDKVIDKS
jgi:hypothetical protein